MSKGSQPAVIGAEAGLSTRRLGTFASKRADPVVGVRPPATFAERAATWGPLAALVAMCIVFSIFADRFATIDNLQAILDSAAVLAVVSVGLTFVLLLGAIDLSVEGVMAACGLAFSLLVLNNRNGWDLGLIAVVPVVLIGAGFGFTSGMVSARLKVPSFMTTVGMSAVGIGIATLLFGGLQPNILDPTMSQLTSARWFGFTPLTYVAVACVVFGALVQAHTRLGRYAIAIGSAEGIVALSGINVRRYKSYAFALAGGLYGLGAIMLTVQLQAGVVDAAVGLNFEAIAAAVVGGTLLSGGQGGVRQTAVGVLIVKVLDNGLVLLDVSPYLQRAVQGVVVVAAVVAATWPIRQRLRVVK